MTRPYARLRGRGRRAVGFLSLAAPVSTAWVAADHLLTVDTFGASEDYRRFFFKEIQAFAVRRTRQYEILAAVIVPLVVATTWGALATTEVARGAFAIFAAIFGLLLAVHLLRGPTCRTYVTTRVGRHELGAFTRMRNARRALDTLRPLVVAAQREVALAGARARAAAGTAVPASTDAPAGDTAESAASA